MKTNKSGNILKTINLRKLAKPAVLFISALFIISMLSVFASNGVQAASTPALHISGTQILTSSGAVVTLRGVDYSWFIEDPNGDWLLPSGTIEWNTWDTTAINSNLAALQSWSVNCIRVLATSQYWIDNTDNYQNNIEYFISTAATYGIYVDLVFWCNSAAQASASTPPSLPYPPYDTSGTFSSSTDFVNFWTSVANTLKGYPNVMFELWNEPNGDSTAEASWMSVTQQAITAIRGTGATNIIVAQWNYNVGIDFQNYLGGSIWNLNWVNQYPLSDPQNNILYSTHIYRNVFYNDGNSSDGYAYSYNDMKWALTQVGVIGFNKALWIGEIGCNLWASNMDNEYAWFNNTLTILNENGIGFDAWAWAPWTTGTEWGLVTGQSNSNYAPNQAGQIFEQQISES